MAATDLFGEPIEAHPPWFKPDSFLRADFDPDAYVAGLRSYVPLESLAAELRSHLAALRAELVGLINRDYADFVGLSARLKGVDAAAARMRAPLADLRDKVAGFRAGASAALAALRAGLEQRATATVAHGSAFPLVRLEELSNSGRLASSSSRSFPAFK